MFDAVIFDWDGTLAETRKVVVTSFHKVLDDLSLEVDDEFIESRMGTSAREIFTEILESSNINFDEKTIENLVKKRVEAELEMSDQVRLNKGAFDLLSSMKDKVKLALASMNNKPVINRMLKTCGLSEFFDVVLSADEVLNPKPNPEIFLRCATKLALKPEMCVVIEDSVFGVRAAKAARMRCIAVLSGASSKSELEHEQPDIIVDSIEDKKTILRFIFGNKSDS